MAFEPGNQLAIGRGRPRTVERELGRLRQAAQHVDALLQEHALIDQLGRRQTPFPTKLLYAAQALRREIADVEAAAELIESIVGGDGLAPRREGRRRRRQGAADEWRQHWMTAGAALDRLVPDAPEMPQ